ncbi:Hint domain-containing protein [Roseobacter weihaiensis]|uniref:Hint domain-containing protein n=1 Tax=Roseobacter weihaiensis TaxID=2763262 RepID=UPI001D0B6125|nr:Hint domain-containing protein [Roseobacter sp. H9]
MLRTPQPEQADLQSPGFTDTSARSELVPRPAFGIRIADISALKCDGTIVTGQRKIPTLPDFDKVFAAFAQGTLFQAEQGFVAVEDLLPGDWLMTANGTPEQVTWIGSTTFSAGDPAGHAPIVRVMADTFGMNRPENSINLGPAARVLQTPPDLRAAVAPNGMMTPTGRFVDGVSVVDILPPAPVRLFHVALRQHAALMANGLEVESYHPGTTSLRHLSQTLRTTFLSLFPNITLLSDFGPLHYPRATDDKGQSAA